MIIDYEWLQLNVYTARYIGYSVTGFNTQPMTNV